MRLRNVRYIHIFFLKYWSASRERKTTIFLFDFFLNFFILLLRDSIDRNKIVKRFTRFSTEKFLYRRDTLEESLAMEGETVRRRQWTRAIRREDTATYKDTSSRIRRRRIFLVSTGSRARIKRCYELCKTCSFFLPPLSAFFSRPPM